MAIWLTLAGSLLLGLALLWAVTVLTYARGLISPPRMTDGRAMARLGRLGPADLGLKYERVEFTGREGLRVVGWHVPCHASRGDAKLAVLVHGYGDAKVGSLAWAPVFRHLGFDLLLIDLRAHGESGGTFTTAGVWEADDLAHVMRHFTTAARPPTEVVLFGASLGAAVVARFASSPEFADDLVWPSGRVTAVVLDSPVPDFQAGALANARLLNLPGAFVVKPALWLLSKRLGVDFATASTVANLPRCNVPALAIVPTQDLYLQPADRARLRAAFDTLRQNHPTSRWYEPSCPHLLGVSVDPEQYTCEVRALLDSQAH